MDPVSRSGDEFIRRRRLVEEKHQKMLCLVSRIVDLEAVELGQHLNYREDRLLVAEQHI